MSKATVSVTQSWQQIATGAVMVTVKKKGTGTLFFDENQSDDTAYCETADANDQFRQCSDVPTFVKTDGEVWELIVDGAL